LRRAATELEAYSLEEASADDIDAFLALLEQRATSQVDK
jgi:hypothetical protein